MTNLWTQLEFHAELTAVDAVTHGMSGGLRLADSQIDVKMFESELLLDSNFIDGSFINHLGIKSEQPYSCDTGDGPYLVIVEEPRQRGFRFRYECEGPSHGGLPGYTSERGRRTYPTVKLCNFVGQARIEVQLVTHTDPPQVHAHSLVGRQCNDNGTCIVDVGPNDYQAQFNNLGILHVTKRGVYGVLLKRLREERRRQRESTYNSTEADEESIENEAKELAKSMDLNIVRLKFTAYLQDSTGAFTRALKPAISHPIYDSKSPNASNLKISRLDKSCGSVFGGDEIFLLCDKVQKDDIEVRFFEDDEGGWEAYGDFSPTDVHKQYAIVFKTPPYWNVNIEKHVNVLLQLKRKKGGDCSDPKQFTYVPQPRDKEEIQIKRQKPHPTFNHFGGPGGAGGGQGGFSGPGGGGLGGGSSGFRSNPQMDNFGHFSNFRGFGGALQMSATSQQPVDGDSTSNPSTRTQAQQQLFQIVSALQSRSSTMANTAIRALLEYSRSGDIRPLVAIHRHLCGVADENGDTPLHLAIIHQQPGVVQQLLQSIVSIPGPGIMNRVNHLDQSPLHLAVVTRQLKVAELLLRLGADPSLPDQDGRTPLHLAAYAGDEVAVRLLLTHLGEKHAHLVNTVDFSGLYPLHLAVRRGGERCLQLLVESGAKVNAQEQKSGCTALHLAVREGLVKVASILITELKADVNMCTFGGNSPLHLAASQGSPPLCSMLIAAGANKNLENDEPLFFSSSSSDEDDEEEEDRIGRAMGDVPAEDTFSEQVQAVSSSLERVQINSRKRPAAGHKPYDLAKCQRVRNLLGNASSPKPSLHSPKKPKQSTEESGGSQPINVELMEKLASLLSQNHIPWRELAKKLGMLTLAHLFQESPSPCQNLLENYQLSGGQVEGLVEALQSLGVNEGVRLLKETQVGEDKQNTDTTVDSGFGSHGMEEEDGELAAMATS